MSERMKNTSNVSNEGIIDDLTKDLQSLGTENQNYDEFVINSQDSIENITPAQEQSELKKVYTGSETESDDEGILEKQSKNKDKDSDTESIDELALKDAEVDLTDDQKEERRRTAEEMKVEGNSLFMEGKYDLSVTKYTEGLRICPLQFAQQRSILYCNRSAARLKLERYKQAIKDCTKAIELDDKYMKAYIRICPLQFAQQRSILYCNRSAARLKLERYKQAIKDCTKAIELDDKYMKAYIRRAQSYEALEKFDESLADYKKILELDPSHAEAMRATVRLPPLIEEKNEKLKTEMMGKLKDLGNMILKPFGLSTENFQLEQDPESKGYKINFKQ